APNLASLGAPRVGCPWERYLCLVFWPLLATRSGAAYLGDPKSKCRERLPPGGTDEAHVRRGCGPRSVGSLGPEQQGQLERDGIGPGERRPQRSVLRRF